MGRCDGEMSGVSESPADFIDVVGKNGDGIVLDGVVKDREGAKHRPGGPVSFFRREILSGLDDVFHQSCEVGHVLKLKHCRAAADGVEMTCGLMNSFLIGSIAENAHQGDREAPEALLGIFSEGVDELDESGGNLGRRGGTVGGEEVGQFLKILEKGVEFLIQQSSMEILGVDEPGESGGDLLKSFFCGGQFVAKLQKAVL